MELVLLQGCAENIESFQSLPSPSVSQLVDVVSVEIPADEMWTRCRSFFLFSFRLATSSPDHDSSTDSSFESIGL